MLLKDNFSINKEKFKLIYLSILSLDIPLESWAIPQSKKELDSIIYLITDTLRKHDELIRRAASLMEQIERQNSDDGYYGLVQEYLTKFEQLWQSHPDLKVNLDSDKQEAIALKLLANLLFYSGKSGESFIQSQLYSSGQLRGELS